MFHQLHNQHADSGVVTCKADILVQHIYQCVCYWKRVYSACLLLTLRPCIVTAGLVNLIFIHNKDHQFAVQCNQASVMVMRM